MGGNKDKEYFLIVSSHVNHQMIFYFFLLCPDNCVLDNSANSYSKNNDASDMRKVQILPKTHVWGNSNLRILKVVNFCNYAGLIIKNTL